MGYKTSFQILFSFQKSRFFNQLNLLKSKIMPSFNAFALLFGNYGFKTKNIYDILSFNQAYCQIMNRVNK